MAKEEGAEKVFAAGTMALRIADNASEFTARAAKQGTPVEIISGEDEARLGFRAVVDDPHFAGAMRITIIDPGGQSTEVVSGEPRRENGTPDFQQSFPIGTLGIRGEIMKTENPGPDERLRGAIALDTAFRTHERPDPHGLVVTLGAAGTNLVSLREKLTSWQPELVHGAELTYEEISRAVGWLCGLTDAERAVLPGLEPGRETTIHIGALILERALAYLKAESTKVSVRGWRHAYLVERMS
jgi:exopolyphosphatase/guanosine-5'-triphosphate,3'-diphosphate pyrophosphatase